MKKSQLTKFWEDTYKELFETGKFIISDPPITPKNEKVLEERVKQFYDNEKVLEERVKQFYDIEWLDRINQHLKILHDNYKVEEKMTSKKDIEIEIKDNSVRIHGILTICEAYDFLHYFEQQGYDQVWIGDENSTLHLTRSKIIEEEEKKVQESLFDITLKKENKILQEKIAQLELLIKDINGTK